MKTRLIASLLLFTALSSCGVAQSDYDALLTENAALQDRVDALENGEARLVALADQQNNAGDFSGFKASLDSLKQIHPQSREIERLGAALKEIEATESQALAEKQAKDAEVQRLANMNNTGIWRVTNYVDDFGEPTDDKLIRNNSLIRGTFSNTATQNSPLNVRFLIDAANEVDLLLYEYAGNNPVKAYATEKYVVRMLEANGERHRLSATNRSDRLSFGPQHSSIITDALARGGEVKFALYQADTPTTEYAFSVAKSDYFDNALRLMGEREK